MVSHRQENTKPNPTRNPIRKQETAKSITYHHPSMKGKHTKEKKQRSKAGYAIKDLTIKIRPQEGKEVSTVEYTTGHTASHIGCCINCCVLMS
jgi:hypothetical protein